MPILNVEVLKHFCGCYVGTKAQSVGGTSVGFEKRNMKSRMLRFKNRREVLATQKKKRRVVAVRSGRMNPPKSPCWNSPGGYWTVST